MPAFSLKPPRGTVSAIGTLADGALAFSTDARRVLMGDGSINHVLGVKHNIAATAAPGVGDDSADGYSPGSLWVDTTNDLAYVCLDSSAGAAVWQLIGSASGTIAVASGGTGRTSHTAYAVLCGGTTSTGAQQSIASVGTSGQVLTSNGAGALPTFQTPSSSLDITGLTAADPADADEVPIYDASASANRKVTLARVIGLSAHPPGGRLTPSSTNAVSTSNVFSAATLYYLPYVANRVGLWDGTRWVSYAFADAGVSLDISGVTASKPYDVFGYVSGGALALEYLVWTDDTTRATAISVQDGRWCKSGDKTRLYLGSFYADVTGGVNDTSSGSRVWNVANRVLRRLNVSVAGFDWTYATNTWRAANASTSYRVDFMQGLSLEAVVADVGINYTGASSAGSVGIGLDSTSANSAQNVNEAGPAGSTDVQTTRARYHGYVGVGKHSLYWIEKVRAGTGNFRGVLTPSSGLTAEVWA